jgi:hypothetical protein
LKRTLKDQEFNSNIGIEEAIVSVWNAFTFNERQGVLHNYASHDA